MLIYGSYKEDNTEVCVGFNKYTEKVSDYRSIKEIVKFIGAVNRKVVFIVCLELQRGQEF